MDVAVKEMLDKMRAFKLPPYTKPEDVEEFDGYPMPSPTTITHVATEGEIEIMKKAVHEHLKELGIISDSKLNQ